MREGNHSGFSASQEDRSGYPRLLFLSPIMPAESGNGLAMRAGLTLEALSARFRVHLIVIPISGPTVTVSECVRKHAAEVVVEPLAADPLGPFITDDHAHAAARLMAWPTPLLARFATADLRQRIASRASDIEPAMIHIMRLYLVPYAEQALERSTAPAILDLDDDEVHTRERLREMHASRGDHFSAQLESREADRFRGIESSWTRRFGRLLVASDVDRGRLGSRLGMERIAVFPNGVRVPEPREIELMANGREPRRFPNRQPQRTLLFVGTLGYAPNEDAALTLVEQILPRLRGLAGQNVSLRIAGAGASDRLRAAAIAQGAEMMGYVECISNEYARADVVAMPLRSGGGTRIKLLEALAHERAVVTTTIGAEGVAVEHDRNVMIADDPDAFAQACRTLLYDSARAHRLAIAGRMRVRECYDRADIAAILAAGHVALYDRTVACGHSGRETRP